MKTRLGSRDDTPGSKLGLNIFNVLQTLFIPEQLPILGEFLLAVCRLAQTLPVKPWEDCSCTVQQIPQLIPRSIDEIMVFHLQKKVLQHIKGKEQRQIVKDVAKEWGSYGIKAKGCDDKVIHALFHPNDTLPLGFDRERGIEIVDHELAAFLEKKPLVSGAAKIMAVTFNPLRTL